MTSEGAASQEFKKSDYEYYPRTLAADDFWGQVRRTVNGRPVEERQIRMIVDTIMAALDLRPEDTVLDLACGNGALSRYLFASCAALLGVDCSEFLISVAKQHFEQEPAYAFRLEDAAAYVRAERAPQRFTKVLCYGSFSFFSPEAGEEVLAGLCERFTHVDRVFIGNLPDRDLAHLFYSQGLPDEGVLDDHTEQIGIWRSRQELTELAGRCGWKVAFSVMPEGFFSPYRYDALLTRA